MCNRFLPVGRPAWRLNCRMCVTETAAHKRPSVCLGQEVTPGNQNTEVSLKAENTKKYAGLPPITAPSSSRDFKSETASVWELRLCDYSSAIEVRFRSKTVLMWWRELLLSCKCLDVAVMFEEPLAPESGSFSARPFNRVLHICQLYPHREAPASSCRRVAEDS